MDATTEDVTQFYCPKSGGAPGETNTTHHLVPRVAGRGSMMVCLHCKRTPGQIQDAVS